jgi:hypothetical protein
MVTAMHRNVRDRIRDLRKDKIWLSCEDVAQAWKPSRWVSDSSSYEMIGSYS